MTHQNGDVVIPDGSFEEVKGECPHCGGKFFTYKYSHPHIGAYCDRCGSWIRWCPQWTDDTWNKRIKERDMYTCQRCGKPLVGREAHAHHLLPKWFMPQRQYDLNNGICLCTKCHKQIHGNGGTIKESEDNK